LITAFLHPTPEQALKPYSLQLLEIFAQVVRDLVKLDFLKWPKVYVDPSCASEVPLLQSMVRGMKGETVAASGKAPGSSGTRRACPV